MPLFVVVVALVNLALGFALAVYFGGAPRYANSRVPLLSQGKREPSAFMRRLLAMLPRRRSSVPLP